MDEGRRSRVRSGLAGVAAIAALAALAAGLRPDTFFVGDPGVKLIAARNVLARPGRPLEIPLPAIGGAHVPAVGVAALATALLIKSSTAIRVQRGRAFVVGFLYGVAILLRPEAVCFVLGAAVASRLLPSPPRAATLAIAAAGLLAAILPL